MAFFQFGLRAQVGKGSLASRFTSSKSAGLFALAVLMAAAVACSVYDESLVRGDGDGGDGGASASSTSGTGGTQLCSAPGDCSGQDTECQTRTCDQGFCGVQNTPVGTPLAQQTPGDCTVQQCDGMGSIQNAPLDTDAPNDNKECTIDTCSQGMPVSTPKPTNTGCSQGGGFFCNANGDCVQCTTGSQCISLVCNMSTFQCAAPTCVDNVKNGMETDLDCGGPVCPKCATGLMCNNNGDCIGGLCTGVTCAPTCTDTVKNNSETDVDCGGPVCVPCGIGKACSFNTDCLSNKCGAASTCLPQLLISEVRTRGVGLGNDDFVEIYNPTSGSVVLDNQFTLEARSTTAMNYGIRWTGNGTVLAAHGHYLITGSAYAQMPVGDATLAAGISDASSVRLLYGTDVLDALCFHFNLSTQMILMDPLGGYTCEGTSIDNPNGSSLNLDQSMERLPGGAFGNMTDTNDNSLDFMPLSPALPQNTMSPPTP